MELAFISWLNDSLQELKGYEGGARFREVIDQIDRASLSALLNTAEGNGKRQLRVRAKFFDDARGSATECAACLDALVARRACTAERDESGKALLVRIVSIRSKLVDRFSAVEKLSEEPIEHSTQPRTIEDDDEDALRRPK